MILSGARIHDGRPGFQITVNGFGHLTEPLQGIQIGMQIFGRTIPAELFNHLAVQQIVLGGQYGGRTLGNAFARQPRLGDNGIQSAFFQARGAEKSGHAASDDTDFRVNISAQLPFREGRNVIGP